MGMYLHVLFLQYYFLTSLVCNAVAFVEEPSGGRLDGYCGRILRAQTQGTRKDGHHEFRLRVEGDPESYQPGSTYRVMLLATSPSYFRGFTLIALKEGREGTTDDDYTGQFQCKQEHTSAAVIPHTDPNQTLTRRAGGGFNAAN
ncbi:Spondin-1, partial [Dissostichus eleginoides]